MVDAMVLRGFAARTQMSYVAAVRGLARYTHQAPDTLSAEEVQGYLLHLIRDKKLAYASVNQASCACRFLFREVLGRHDPAFDIPMAKVPKHLPRVLSRDEVSRLFAAAPNLRARTLLMTTYAAGLRVSEVCALKVSDIESAPDRMCLKVRDGKGGKDRYTLLSPCLLETLRQYWRAARPKEWLFPGAHGTKPMDITYAQRIYAAARDKAGLGKEGGIHSLRHAFVTHLLESGGGPADAPAPAGPWSYLEHHALPALGAEPPDRHSLAPGFAQANPALSRALACHGRPLLPPRPG
jgi:site-specific recombinase XerD